MLTYNQGDIFTSDAQVLVNPVNTTGFAVAGLSAKFSRRYPESLPAYVLACLTRRLQVGRPHLHRRGKGPWILHFPTKNHIWEHAKTSHIEAGLQDFAANYKAWGITSAAFPKLGCGEGRLDWAEVSPLMDKHLRDLPGIQISIYV